MLQPFAMKRTLEQMGYEVEMIRYRQARVWKVYSPWTFSKLLCRNIGAMVFHWLTLPWQIAKQRRFYSYMEKFVAKRGFEKYIKPDLDYYIFGSDQIWNPVVTDGFDDVYFGTFDVKQGAKKIAYAASAEAIEYTEKQVEYLKSRLMQFDSIAVREASFAKRLKEVTGIADIEFVVDPTLLADPAIYSEISEVDPLQGERYVLFYKIRNSMCFAEKILDYARRNNAKMLILSSWIELPILKFACKHKDVVYIPHAGIEIFIGAIRNAQCVFTPSFHGIVFPILFHKPFYSLVLDDKWNSRADNLLTAIDLRDRLLTLSMNVDDALIDYEQVDVKVSALRKSSFDYLRQAMN
jgi:hypothetical protein